MTPQPESTARRYGMVFDEIAAEYDRRRPAYPDELIDQACQVAGIGSGDHVLEVGCGSGQLTRGLLARGLHVTALEPGESLMALARRMRLHALTRNFLSLLVDRQRIAQIDLVTRKYRDLLDDKIGRVRAVVTSALPLSHADEKRVRDALHAATRREVQLESKTDPEIIGGLVTQVGGVVWDGSLRTQLERLRDELKQAPL